MGQAFDAYGDLLGSAYGDTKREVFEKLNRAASVEMPRYRSHKDVWALKIHDISDPTEPGNESDGSRMLQFEEKGYADRRVSADFVRRHLPLVHLQNHPYRGGYFVVYKDGYESFSPAQAFEEGYTRL